MDDKKREDIKNAMSEFGDKCVKEETFSAHTAFVMAGLQNETLLEQERQTKQLERIADALEKMHTKEDTVNVDVRGSVTNEF